MNPVYSAIARNSLLPFFAVFLLVSASGCSPENAELEQLKKENPFRTAPIENPKPKIILSCQYYPVELSDQITLESLLQPDPTSGEPLTDDKIPLYRPFGGETNALWQKNGFDVFLISGQHWPRLSQNLARAGGRMLAQPTVLFRTPDEQANFSTYARYEPTSLFINEGENALRGYTLGEGACLFRMSCVPNRVDQTPDVFTLTLVPVFESADMKESYERDELGNLRRVRNRQEVLFSPLRLSGPEPPDSFLCVVYRPAGNSLPNAGSLFLRQVMDAQNIQMMCFFIPRLQIMQPVLPEGRSEAAEK